MTILSESDIYRRTLRAENSCEFSGLIAYNLPLIVQNTDGMVGSKIKNTRNYRYKIIGNCPFVVIFSFVKIHEIACHPEIPSPVRVNPLIKLLLPFGLCLPANFYTPD